MELPPEIWSIIFKFLGNYVYLTKYVCCSWYALSPKIRFGRFFSDLFIQGHLNILKLLPYEPFQETLSLAAYYGHLDIIQYFLQKRIYNMKLLLSRAIHGEQSKIVEWIHAKIRFISPIYPNGYNPYIKQAAKKGNLEIIKLLFEKLSSVEVGGIYAWACMCPDEKKAIDIAIWLREKQIPLNQIAINASVKYNHKNLFEIMKRWKPDFNKRRVIRGAFYADNLDIIKEYHGNKFDLPSVFIRDAIRGGAINVLKWVFQTHHKNKYDTSFCEIAALFGRYKCLEYLHKEGYPLTNKALNLCTKLGNDYFFCFVYIYEQGIIDGVTENIVKAAIRHGNIKILDFLLEKKHTFPSDCYDTAVSSSKYNVILWLVQNKFEEKLNNPNTKLPVILDSLVIISWLYKKGVNLDDVMLEAVNKCSLGIVDYLYKKGYPVPVDLAMKVASKKSKEFLHWLKNKKLI